MHVSKKKLNGRSLVASGRINPFVISYVNYLDLILTYMSLWCDRRDKISQKKAWQCTDESEANFLLLTSYHFMDCL